jgi:hypothetical protein
MPRRQTTAAASTSRRVQQPAHGGRPAGRVALTEGARRADQQERHVDHEVRVVDHARQLDVQEGDEEEHEAGGRDVVERGHGVHLDAAPLQQDLHQRQPHALHDDAAHLRAHRQARQHTRVDCAVGYGACRGVAVRAAAGAAIGKPGRSLSPGLGRTCSSTPSGTKWISPVHEGRTREGARCAGEGAGGRGEGGPAAAQARVARGARAGRRPWARVERPQMFARWWPLKSAHEC